MPRAASYDHDRSPHAARFLVRWLKIIRPCHVRLGTPSRRRRVSCRTSPWRPGACGASRIDRRNDRRLQLRRRHMAERGLGYCTGEICGLLCPVPEARTEAVDGDVVAPHPLKRLDHGQVGKRFGRRSPAKRSPPRPWSHAFCAGSHHGLGKSYSVLPGRLRALGRYRPDGPV